MKTWKSIFGGLIVSFCCAVPSFAQLNFGRIDTSLYLGGAVGTTHFRSSCEGVTVSCDDKDTGWKVFAGYQFTPNFAIEGGYTDLGKVTANGVISGVSVNAEGKARGFELAAVALFPIYREFSLYGKLGAYRAKTDVSVTGAVPGFRRTIASSDHSTDFTFGAGVRYGFSPNLGARLEWQRYQKVGGDNTGTENIDLFTLGLLYSF